jgi:hypothetical protein
VTKGWRCKRKRLQRQSPEGHFDFHLTGGEMALVEDLPATIKMDVSIMFLSIERTKNNFEITLELKMEHLS